MKINGLNLNSQIGINKEPKDRTIKEEVKEQTKQPELKQKSADEVLNFMANTGEMNGLKKSAGKKVIPVSQYVTPEQAKRIAGFVLEFTGEVEKGLKTMEKELGHLPEFKEMSDTSKMDIAVGAFAKTNL